MNTLWSGRQKLAGVACFQKFQIRDRADESQRDDEPYSCPKWHLSLWQHIRDFKEKMDFYLSAVTSTLDEFGSPMLVFLPVLHC